MTAENYHVILAPMLELAEKYVKEYGRPEYSVEAEYGDVCIEGSLLTMAHHGSRSGNPAPCNWNAGKQNSGTILISHIDLDTLGGIMDIQGIKPDDQAFWEGAEFIDVYGLHHMYELYPDVRDKLNAYYAWNDSREHEHYKDIKDVTEVIDRSASAICHILNPLENRKLIEEGRLWEKDKSEKIEANLIRENEYVRSFITEDVFCSAAYYSPKFKAVVPATVVYNKKRKTITLAFADGGRENGGRYSAVQIVQELWGPEAGGRDGIAASPRGQAMTENDFCECTHIIYDLYKMN